ncbi:MAG: amine oxidase [Herbinix sp.]|jgi:phytoene dehydrogenase-like protein|nr:amine oxidase [Herbinix sp.]
MMKILPKMSSYDKISVSEYSKRFHHPAIRCLLTNVVGEAYNASALFFTLGCLASGDGAYLEGGSLGLAQRMAKRFNQLGGKILYGSPVDQVIVEHNRAVGIIVKGQRINADAIIITSDTLSATKKLFAPALSEPWIERMHNNTKLAACTFVSIGVECDLSNLPEDLLFPLKKSFTFVGQEITTLSLHNYAGYPGYAPKGCSTLTTIITGDTYEFWKAKKECGEYDKEKENLGNSILAFLSQVLPQTAGKVAVIDVATPLTYERYCGTLHGSWMAVTEKGTKSTAYPLTSESTKSLYFAGQRLQTPGGLPVAVDTGRRAVQYLCKDTNVVFQGKLR